MCKFYFIFNNIPWERFIQQNTKRSTDSSKKIFTFIKSLLKHIPWNG